jgi:hypothetical protein
MSSPVQPADGEEDVAFIGEEEGVLPDGVEVLDDLEGALKRQWGGCTRLRPPRSWRR